MATYDSPWIAEAIGSVLGQTHGAWELVVIDDADCRRTERLVVEREDQRIRYVANTEHLGPGLSYRKGIGLSSNAWVALINHDDVWEPSLLETLSGALDQYPDAVVAFGDHWVIDTEGCVNSSASASMTAKWGRVGLKVGLHRPFARLAIVDQAIPLAQCALWDRQAIPEIPRWAGDRYDYWIQVALGETGKGAVYAGERLARFRVHEKNLGGSGALARRLEGVRFYRRMLGSMDLGANRVYVQSRLRHAVGHLLKWPGWVGRQWAMGMASRWTTSC